MGNLNKNIVKNILKLIPIQEGMLFLLFDEARFSNVSFPIGSRA
jgi:hypothetical protein